MRTAFLVSTLLVLAHTSWANIEFIRVPTGGLQPQAAVDPQGALHLIYFKGEPAAGDVVYIRRDPDSAAFTPPLRINSQPNTVIAIGTVRGAHLALGKDGRPHVAETIDLQLQVGCPRVLPRPGSHWREKQCLDPQATGV